MVRTISPLSKSLWTCSFTSVTHHQRNIWVTLPARKDICITNKQPRGICFDSREHARELYKDGLGLALENVASTECTFTPHARRAHRPHSVVESWESHAYCSRLQVNSTRRSWTQSGVQEAHQAVSDIVDRYKSRRLPCRNAGDNDLATMFVLCSAALSQADTPMQQGQQLMPHLLSRRVDNSKPHLTCTGIFTSAKEVMFLPDFVCLSMCQQDNPKSYGRIFLKFSGNDGNGKNYQ